MKALVYTDVKKLAYQDYDMPVATGDQNLIKIHSVGICGSDMHGYLGHDERRIAPMLLGHEAAGVVEQGPMAGKRVTINPLITCGTCEACVEGRRNICQSRQLISLPPQSGAFAEYLVMPSQNLYEVPSHTSMDQAAMAEPLAVCWHSVRLGIDAMFRNIEDARCLVLGGGAIGVGCALSLVAKGASHIAISELNQNRRDAVRAIGPFHMIEGDTLNDQNSTYDLVIDAVGFKSSRADASELVKPGGVIVHVGLGDNNGGFDTRRATLQEITFIGTYTYNDQDFSETVDGIISGAFGPLDWMKKVPLSQGHQAFKDILDAQISEPKVILNP